MVLHVINYFLVCGFLLVLMKAVDRVLLTYAVFLQDILPGVELVIEASENIRGDDEQRMKEEAHKRNLKIKRISAKGRRSFRGAWIWASGALALSIISYLIFSSEILLKIILGCGLGIVVFSLGYMLLMYRKVSCLIADFTTQMAT